MTPVEASNLINSTVMLGLMILVILCILSWLYHTTKGSVNQGKNLNRAGDKLIPRTKEK